MTGHENDETQSRDGRDLHRRKRAKNVAVALAIAAFCVVVYLVSIIKMSGGS